MSDENDVETETSSLSAAALPFPVVGVGASSGGLEAFIELLGSLPADPGMAFLFVLHLEPNRKTQLADILGGATGMPVREAADGVVVEINHVYILPPNANMELSGRRLVLIPRLNPRSPNMPADVLFRSLSAEQKSRAVGVILSGGGSDGTLGFQTIKSEGGITFAQDEKSARQISMPRCAIADGNVDYILPPVGISQQLLRLVRHPYNQDDGSAPLRDSAESVSEILNVLRVNKGVDFTRYKRTTIERRIQRRMALRGNESIAEYVKALRADPHEVQILYQDFLIRVTRFFREPEAFEALKQKVFPRLIHRRSADLPIRIWVAGCATGEEVYSLAICLLEFLSAQPLAVPIKLLATDINDAALKRARQGVYVDNIELDVTPERLRRFFVRSNGSYQISKAVRDHCVFSKHNLTADPPFSRLDLVSCRNVLIYMDSALQRRVLPVLHYSLNSEGFLFLGNSESVGSLGNLFESADSKHRIFSKKQSSALMPVEFGAFPQLDASADRARLESPPLLWTALDVLREADRIVLHRYAPVGVVVDEAGAVVQFRGRTAAYLEPAPGLASLDLLRMLREGLLVDVRSALNQARTENTVAAREGFQVVEEHQMRQVSVEVIPFKVLPAGLRFFLVLFRDSGVAKLTVSTAGDEARSQPTEQQTLQLQQELAAIRDYLQSLIEKHESTNEELKSANEEIMSANEELQSTNEELQTAKEEAQSANEELATVNEELQHRNADLARVNNDLVNLLNGVNIPIVMVSRDLRIRRYTPPAERLFNLIPTDVGRPISDIKPNLEVADLGRLIVGVIDNLAPYEAEVRDRDERIYALKIRPYVTLEQKIDGASVVLLEIGAPKRGPDQSKQESGSQ